MITIPDTPAASAALEVAATYLSAAMLSHSHRVYLWGATYGDEHGLRYDAELLFVAAMFHDVSLVPVFDSHTVSFEETSGHVARVFAAGASRAASWSASAGPLLEDDERLGAGDRFRGA